MKSILIGILFLAFIENGLCSIKKCYSDDSVKDCPESSPSCYKAEVTKDGKKIISRGCGLPSGLPIVGVPEDICKTLTIVDVETHVCTCLTELCNSANVQMKSMFVTLTLLSVVIFVRFI